MSVLESELERRLDALPGGYDGFARITATLFARHGLLEEAMQMLDGMPDATASDVTLFDCEYCGAIELVDEGGMRKPAEIGQLRLTSGMRETLAEMKGKTFKAYECVSSGNGGRSNGVVGIVLGQHAVHLASREFPFVVAGARVELSALRCERKALSDDFGLPPDAPVRAYVVGERITGVELATDHVDLAAGISFDVDVAVAVKTAHAVYTFSRESWAATGIRVIVENGLFVPAAADELNGEWLRAHPELGTAKVTRSIAKLA